MCQDSQVGSENAKWWEFRVFLFTSRDPDVWVVISTKIKLLKFKLQQ